MANKTIGDLAAGGALTGTEKFEVEVPGTPAASQHNTATQIAAFVASVLGRPGFRYTVDLDSTADSDPGAGLLKFNNGTFASATFVYIDDATIDGVDLSTYFGALGSTGFLRLVSANDPGEWAVLRWTSVADGTGYWKFGVAVQASAGSFEDGDEVLVLFDSDANTGTGVATDAIFDAAGDLIVGTGNNTAARLAIGTALQTLRVNAAGTALEWAAPSGGGSSQGKHLVYIAAAAMGPSASGGCAPLARAVSGSNQPDIVTLDFDPTTEEYAQFSLEMPKSWNEGTVTFAAVWSHAAAVTNFGVVWGLQAVAVGDGDAIGAAFGTAQTVTDTGGTTATEYRSAESSAITIAGSPAASDTVYFRVYRKSADASDTLAVDARLHGVALFITTDADTDA